MLFEGLIITGTSCAGKTTVASQLCQTNEHGFEGAFQIVRAITTRNQRPDDRNYDYINDKSFEKLYQNQQLMTRINYKNKKYGIKIDEYTKIIENEKIPILIVSPESAKALITENGEKYMCVFIDAPNEELVSRNKTRSGTSLSQEEKQLFLTQVIEDRRYASTAHYVMQNRSIDTTVSLILLLWKHQGHGGPLSKNMIIQMLNCGMLLERADDGMVNGASYDLRLGDEYYYGGEIKRLSDKTPFLTIEPYDYAIVSCKELACMPRDVIAKFGLSVSLFCQGIILSNGPQIDPGFRGTLFCLLFNTSNRAVHLKRGKHYATIEFNKLLEAAPPYHGQYQDSEKIIEYIPANALHGAINELKCEIEKLKNESRFMQNIYLGVAGLMFALISILLVIR